MSQWIIVEDDRSGAPVRALLEQHFAGMLANSPEESCHFLDLSGLRRPEVTFWSIWDGDTLAGCGALKRIDAAHGEVKSMRVHYDYRGRGAGYAMLRHIIATAQNLGLSRLSLETGTAPAFDDAVRLYARAGFSPCPPFADYREDPFSRFMTLAL